MKKLFSLLMVLLMTAFAFATDYIAGSFNGWSTSANALPSTIRLAEGTYEFKIVLGGSSWVGNNGTMTRSNCSGWTFDGNQGNCKITADMTGDYVFTWANNKLTVTYPTTPAALTYYVTGTENLVGKDKAWNIKAVEMNEGTHTFTALGAGEYEMKVTDGTNWYGYEKLDAEKSSKGLSNKSGNIGFEIETSSDVTVSFDGKAIVVTGTFKQPEPAKEMVIYYVNTTNWEKVNAYLWTPEEAAWPGKAMTKEKEQINGYDVYSHTTTDVYDGQNIIFSNNGSNKTTDLTIDAEKPYYYNGEWYKKEDIPAPAKTFDLTIVQDSLWSEAGAKVAAWIWGKDLAGQWTAWATNNNDTLSLKVNENADSIIFKRFAPEVEVPYWEGSAEYQWNQIDAGEIAECHMFIITDWDEGAWCERPVKCEPGYAIMVNGARHMLTLNAEQQDYTEYWIDSLELKVNDEIVLFDTCSKVTFKVAVKGYEGLKPVGESDTLKVTEEAYYQFYLKLIYGGD
ncbi:MAG: starch-binding protein, partial [Bacteroidales bacterium]|nr:starch-binding protein [Bacteroidales bacterium]